MGWSKPNLTGVLPFPRGQEEDLFMGGLGMRLNVDTGEPQLALAMMVDLNLATIPEAIFLCVDSDPAACRGERLVSREVYAFDRIERETFLLPNIALQIGWKAGDTLPDHEGAELDPGLAWRFMPYLLLGLQSSVTNTGFENDLSTLPEDSLTSLWMGYIGIGGDATVAGLVLGTSLIIPIEGEPAIDFGLVFNFRVGAQFD
jgi:hypothetical protein